LPIDASILRFKQRPLLTVDAPCAIPELRENHFHFSPC